MQNIQSTCYPDKKAKDFATYLKWLHFRRRQMDLRGGVDMEKKKRHYADETYVKYENDYTNLRRGVFHG